MYNALDIVNLQKKYVASEFCLKDVSFTIPKGSVMGFVGKNGAGKTTTINLILNIIKKDNGTVKLFGKEMLNDDVLMREKIGVVFDNGSFSPVLTPLQLSKIFSGIYGNWDEAYYFSLLEKFNVPLKRKIKMLSHGTEKKLSIAVALAHHPQLLILDEPTAGIDPIVRDEILDLLLAFVVNENNTILLSSHISSDLEKIADYITFIYEGKIVLSEKKDVLLYEYGIVRCKEKDFLAIPSTDYMTSGHSGLQFNILVSNKDEFKKKHRNLVIDAPSIDEISKLILKGE